MASYPGPTSISDASFRSFVACERIDYTIRIQCFSISCKIVNRTPLPALAEPWEFGERQVVASIVNLPFSMEIDTMQPIREPGLLD